ncbi:MAG: hypothetical protein ACI9OU_000628 [Candidatus Promineifilaceae bacterium]|jgi:hypothetical protein
MKKDTTTLRILLCSLVAGLMAFTPARAADDNHEAHDHEKEHAHEESKAGPNGGRVFTSVEPRLEFLVTADRKVQITALDDDFKPTKMGDQTVRAVGGNRSKPTRMKFVKQGDIFVSDVALPDGNDFPMVVQIKPSADAKTIIEKFNLNLNDCPACKLKEYACICAHGDH